MVSAIAREETASSALQYAMLRIIRTAGILAYSRLKAQAAMEPAMQPTRVECWVKIMMSSSQWTLTVSMRKSKIFFF